MLSGYGFELFNLNLTIDDEVLGSIDHSSIYITTGRWGQYLLAKYLLPQPVIPFVPLFIALFFFLCSVLLLLDNWNLKNNYERIMVGSTALAFPTMGFMLTFSAINFGIGISLFCIVLAYVIFMKYEKMNSYYGVFPAAFAISIYQGIAIVLPTLFLIHLLLDSVYKETQKINWHLIYRMITFSILSFSLYVLAAKISLFLINHELWYVDSYFSFKQIYLNFADVFSRTIQVMSDTYSGSYSIFGSSLSALPFLIILSITGFSVSLAKMNTSISVKLFIFFLYILLISLPFIPGLFAKGTISIRFLIGVPFTIAGILALGFSYRSKFFRLAFLSTTAITLFQSVVSLNTLFSSSALALEADRNLAGRLLSSIHSTLYEYNDTPPVFFEVVGHISRPSTRLNPKIETFGASFYEWDGGSSGRILFFLKTIEQLNLNQLPDSRKKEFFDKAKLMPDWPKHGSIVVIGDTLVIKLGQYTEQQLIVIHSN